MKCSAATISAVWIRAAWWQTAPLKRLRPPMLGFRSDPYDNQSGEMEADGVGLYGDDTVTTKEVLKFEEVE